MSDAPPVRQLHPRHVDTAASDRAARVEHEAQQMRLLPNRLDQWGVGSLERRIIVGGVKKWPGIAAVDAFSRSTRQSLFLWGASGSGKSVAAVYGLTLFGRRQVETSVLGQTWEWVSNCMFLPAPKLERIQTSFDPADKQAMADAISSRFLVIDDLGSETRSVKGGLTTILYERNRFERRTLLTGNLSPDALKPFTERYGERATRRLREFGDIRECRGGAR